MASISLKNKSKSGNLTAPGDVDLGAMIPIATSTVGAGGVATVTFSSIPQNYEHLQIRYMLSASSLNTDLRIQLNADTGANYTRHYLYGLDGSSVVSGASTSNTSTSIGYAFAAIARPYSGVADILDSSNTSKYKTIRSLSGGCDASAASIIYFSGLWLNTSAISSIVLTQSSGNFSQYSSFALYGIKRAGA